MGVNSLQLIGSGGKCLGTDQIDNSKNRQKGTEHETHSMASSKEAWHLAGTYDNRSCDRTVGLAATRSFAAQWQAAAAVAENRASMFRGILILHSRLP
jgi:hypothetical protein